MIRSVWKTRLGFYLAAMGSAFGLGSLWRFPYVVAENGGGAFVLLYVFLLFLVGMPVLIGELLLGKKLRSGLMNASKLLGAGSGDSKIGRPKWVTFSGRLGVVLCLVVLSYYAVISGWVLHFFMQFVVGEVNGQGTNGDVALKALQDNGWLQIGLTSVHLLIVGVIVAKDVEEGLEKAMGYTMPAFVGLLLILIFKAMSLDSSEEALRFLLYPDFSKLGFSSIASALGHVFFTLSLGFGTMVTFGSYLQDKSFVPLAGFRVAILDSVISIFAGILVFPLVIGSGTQGSGVNLLFETVPMLLGQIPGGQIYGIGFFLCLYLAALGASIGLLEAIVTNFRDHLKVRRSVGVITASFSCFLLAIVPAMSSTLLRTFQVKDSSVLALLDTFVVNWILPISVLLILKIVDRLVDEKFKKDEFIDETDLASAKIYGYWKIIIRWVAPTVIIGGLALQVIGLLVR